MFTVSSEVGRLRQVLLHRPDLELLRLTPANKDDHVLGNGAVLVGMSERTTPQAVEVLARRLFTAGAARDVIVAQLPRRRAFMHLDTVLTMVGRDAFTVYPELPAPARRHVPPNEVTRRRTMSALVADRLDAPATHGTAEETRRAA